MSNAIKHRDSLKPKLIALSVAACFSLSATQTLANPTGGTVVSGGASFAASGNALTITNTANAIINWQSFSIGVNEITRFLQSSGASAVLNRVVGANGVIPQSVIDGILSSNGRVFLLNSSGILIGAGARIDVAGFVASSLNLSDQDFLAGKMRFTEVPGAGKVSNAGVIDTSSSGPGGRVFLIGPDVENSGVIRTPQGQIILAAGKSVELVSENSPFVTVNITADTEHALNVGQLLADSGRIGMFGALVRQGGVAQANSAVLGENGEIRLVATKDLTLDTGSVTTANGPSGGNVLLQAQGGTNLIYGNVGATGSSGQGGTIQALGVRVGVLGNGIIDASGDAGGGTVLVGGDAHGANPNVQNAERTLIGPDGVIRADAGATGDGGRVIVWADGDTRFYGSISARGGSQSGNGGFVETSGALGLDVQGGRLDLRAPNGQWGTWLLDPTNVTIISGANLAPGTDPAVGIVANNGVDNFAATPVNGGTVTSGTLETNFLNVGTTRIQATNDVLFKSDLKLIYGGLAAQTFEVRAQHNIDLAADGVAHTITTNGQNVVLSASDFGPTSIGPALNTAGTGSIIGRGNIFTDYGGAAGGNITLSGYGMTVGTLETTGGLDIQGAPAGLVKITALSGGVQTGTITTRGLDGTDFAAGPVLPTAGFAGGAISISAAYGAVVTGNIDASGGRGGNGGATATFIYAGQAGGGGGGVSIGAGIYGPTASITTGTITSSGGKGGISQNNSPTATGTADGGSGGSGGAVSLSSSTGAITVGAMNTSGGSGSNGGDSSGLGYAGSGGSGGFGGAVSLVSNSASVIAGAILTSSGNGGNAGVALTGPAAGSAFVSNGGFVTIAAGNSATTGNITTSGGNGGSGGNTSSVPLGGDGGSVAITATNSVATGTIITHGGSGSTGGNAGAPIAGAAGGGGDVTLTAGTFVTVNGSIDSSGGGFSGPGLVAINATTGDINTGSISAPDLSPGSSGGGVLLSTVYGRIIVNGNIDVRGADGVGPNIDICGDACFGPFPGSQGGNVVLQRTGGTDPGGAAIQVNGNILASGGNGISSQTGAGGNGGNGGGVGIVSVYGGGTFYGSVSVTGGIDTHGGSGGSGATGFAGGAGGTGGVVSLASVNTSSGSINAAGGAGGAGGADAGNGGGAGGAGGNAGNVQLFGYGSIAVGNISAPGGSGGNGGAATVASNTGGRGGDGGTGGLVSMGTSILAGTSVSVGAIDISGGHGGNGGDSSAGFGGAGGAGGSTAQVFIDPDSASVGAITASGGAGGSGGYGGIQGGAGGSGGTGALVVVSGIAYGGTIAVGNVDASGGAGGAGGGSGGASVYGGPGGTGGTAGTIDVFGGTLNFTSGGTFTALGGGGGAGGSGTAGFGGAGGSGGSGGAVNLTAQSGSGYGTILVLSALSTSVNGGLGGAGGATGGVNGTKGVDGPPPSIFGNITVTSTSSDLDTNTVIQGTNQLIQTNNAPSADELRKKEEENKKKNQAAACK